MATTAAAAAVATASTSPSSHSSLSSVSMCAHTTAAAELRGHVLDAASLFASRLPCVTATLASIRARSALSQSIAAYWTAVAHDNNSTVAAASDNSSSTAAAAVAVADEQTSAADAVVAVVTVVVVATANERPTPQLVRVVVSFDYDNGFCVCGTLRERVAQDNASDDTMQHHTDNNDDDKGGAEEDGEALLQAPRDVQMRRYESLLSLLLDVYMT